MSGVRVLHDFPRTFWIANLMELFERGAYYGLNSVLAVYLVQNVAEGGLGFTEQAAGFLQGIVYAAVYVIPILGGALADRYGYRRMLLFAFSLLATGYFASGRVSAYGLVFLFLLVMATGAGLFKPIISGTIARTTDERTSGIGFGIYYWTINLGACVAPLVVSWLKGFSWQSVFTASAAYVAAMLLPTIFLYREPPRPESRRSLREALFGAAEVLRDARFMLMVVVYSGFWVLYFQQFGTVLWHLEDVVDRAPVDRFVNGVLTALGLHLSFRFDAEHVTVINAGTIIVLQYFVSRLVKDRPALPTMIFGMSLGAAGWFLLGLSRSPLPFIAGLVVFSIGEMTAHPKYLSFVGLIAPADRKAVYMGYAFLYGVFGALVGSNLGALLYATLLKPAVGTASAAGRAFLFWTIFAVIGAAAALGLWVFGRAFGQDTPETRRRAALAMALIYGLLAALGLAFLVYGLRSTPVQYKTVVQAALFVLLGAGGLIMTLTGRKKSA